MKRQRSRSIPNSFTVCRLKKDAINKHHYLTLDGAGTQRLKFEQFRSWVMEKPANISAPSRLLACLIAFDAIVVSVDLAQVYQNLSTAQDGLIDRRFSWRTGLRNDARILSCMTLLALAEVNTWSSYEIAIEGLLQAWNQAFQPRSVNVFEIITWEALREQAQSWAQTVLPPVLFGHVSGLSSLSALPVSALIRKSTQLPQCLDQEVDVGTRDACQAMRHVALDAALLGNSVASLNRVVFCSELENRLRPPKKGSVHIRRQEVAKALRAMTEVCLPNDEGCALLLLFAVDLVENGTRRKQELAPETPSKYVSSFAVDWLTAFSGVSIDGIETAEYEKRFKSLLVEGCSSERIAGLKALHHFLRVNWEVPRLSSEVFPESPETEVRANVLWEHEKLRIRKWIDEAIAAAASGHERRVQQLQVAFEIAAHVPLRIKELLMLRLRNVVLEDRYIVIEVAREMRDGREKSKEGRRRVKIHEASAIQVVRGWLQRRRLEMSDDEGYLFGAATNQEALYAKGWMYDTLNQLLKHASGDEQLSMHVLRHTYASVSLDRILQSEGYGEINPLDQLANEMGHVGGHVTTHHYCHVFEPGLRKALDKEAQRCTYEALAQWVGKQPETLRKRVSRAGGTEDAKTKVLEAALEEATQCLPGKRRPPISCNGSPTNPVSVPAAPKALYAVASILMDMAAGIGLTNITLRHSRPLKTVEKIAECVSEYVLEHTGNAVEIRDKCSYGLDALKDGEGKLLSFSPNFHHLNRPHWRKLLKSLADAGSEDLAQVLSYWQRARKGSHFSVHSGDGWRTFLKILNGSSLHPRQLVLVHRPLLDGQLGKKQSLVDQLEAAQEDANNVFGDSFISSECKYRRGQPDIRLLIQKKPISRTTTSHITCMNGLHCSFLAAWVARRISLES